MKKNYLRALEVEIQTLFTKPSTTDCRFCSTCLVISCAFRTQFLGCIVTKHDATLRSNFCLPFSKPLLCYDCKSESYCVKCSPSKYFIVQFHNVRV